MSSKRSALRTRRHGGIRVPFSLTPALSPRRGRRCSRCRSKTDVLPCTGTGSVSPSPSGRVALLAIAYRKITVFRNDSPKRQASASIDQATPNTFGHQLRAKRLARGLGEYQLAELLGVGARLVKDWEANLRSPSEAMLAILADLLGLSESTSTLRPTVE